MTGYSPASFKTSGSRAARFSSPRVRQSPQYRITGKERDAETGLDYFGARYYGSTMGRFTSPDPLYLSLKRLPDPQRLNLYSYTRNNPLSFVDDTGMEYQFNCDTKENCQQIVDEFNSRKDAQFQVSLNDKGVLTVNGDVDASKLSDSERALFDSIKDTSVVVGINVVSASDKVDFGSHDGPRKQTIDAADMAKVAAANKGLAGYGIAHEMMEGYGSTARNTTGMTDYDLWHGYANQFFYSNADPSSKTYLMQNKVFTQYSMDWKLDGKTLTVIKTLSPVPPQSLNYEPGQIKSAEQKQ